MNRLVTLNGDADLTEILTIHRRALPGFFLTGLGDALLGYFYRAFLTDTDATLIVALDEQRITGFVAGSRRPRGHYKRAVLRAPLCFARLAVLEIITHPLRAGSLLTRLLRTRHQAASVDVDDGAKLFAIAVEPQSHRKQVGSDLVRAFEQAMRSRNARGVWLTTPIGNDGAQRFYAAMGYSIVAITDSGNRNDTALLLKEFETPAHGNYRRA